MDSDILTFKVVIIGDARVGKSAFVQKYKTGHFVRKYVPTRGVKETLLHFDTSHGKMILKVWDCAGDQRYEGLRDGYYIGTNAAIVMFSLTDEQSVKSLPNRINDLHRIVDSHTEEILNHHTQAVCQFSVLDIPWTIVGNKIDLEFRADPLSRMDRSLRLKHSILVRSWTGSNFASYNISLKRSYNIDQPFLFLLRKLSGYSDLEIVSKDMIFSFAELDLSQPDEQTSPKESVSSNEPHSGSMGSSFEDNFLSSSFSVSYLPTPDATPIISTPSLVDLEFQFTPEEYALIQGVWDTQKEPREVLASCFGYDLTRRDLLCLKDNGFLSDDILNPYFRLISSSRVYSFTSFFYFVFSAGGYPRVEKWFSKVDLFSFDKVLIPIHLHHHWSLGVLNITAQCIEYYDSLCFDLASKQITESLLLFTQSEHQKRKGIPLPAQWKIGVNREIPQQQNGMDCGVFCSRFAFHISRDEPLSFTQSDIPSLRRRILLDLLAYPPSSQSEQVVLSTTPHEDGASWGFEGSIFEDCIFSPSNDLIHQETSGCTTLASTKSTENTPFEKDWIDINQDLSQPNQFPESSGIGSSSGDGIEIWNNFDPEGSNSFSEESRSLDQKNQDISFDWPQNISFE